MSYVGFAELGNTTIGIHFPNVRPTLGLECNHVYIMLDYNPLLGFRSGNGTKTFGTVYEKPGKTYKSEKVIHINTMSLT